MTKGGIFYRALENSINKSAILLHIIEFFVQWLQVREVNRDQRDHQDLQVNLDLLDPRDLGVRPGNLDVMDKMDPLEAGRSQPQGQGHKVRVRGQKVKLRG